jgi:hypothetical protein
MKKAKIMLLAIAVVSVVGGVLAFKANTLFDKKFCTDIDLADVTCDSFIENSKSIPVGQTTYWYTPTDNTLECDLTTCPTFTTFTSNL